MGTQFILVAPSCFVWARTSTTLPMDRGVTVFTRALVLIGYSIGLALTQESDLCWQTHRIESIMAVEWHPSSQVDFLLELDRFVVQYESEDNYQMHARGQNRLELCGNFPVCADNRSPCQQVFVLYNNASGKFEYALISNWDQLIQVLKNYAKLPEAKHEQARKLVAKLNQFGFKQKAQLALNRATFEFYIIDSTHHFVYRWNLKTQKTDKQTALTNRFSGLFYSAEQNQVYALLWRMNTLLYWQQNSFVPTSLSVKRLLKCQMGSKYLDARKLPFILSLTCIAIVVALVIVLAFIFVNIQKMYSFNFYYSRIEPKEKTTGSCSTKT